MSTTADEQHKTKKTKTFLDDDEDCASCAKLLQQVLMMNATTSSSTDESRPRQLLQALHPQSWRVVPNGIQVEIPAPVREPTRHWKEAAPPSQQQSGNQSTANATTAPVDSNGSRPWFLMRRQTLPHLAFSTAAEAPQPAGSQILTRTPTDHDHITSKDTSHNSSNPTEWLSILCQRCSNHGHESKARAFVTGPSPLSVIVCTNRHEQAQVQAKELREILVHELIHVYDVRHNELNLRDCDNLAYSEVRAAHYAECYSNNKSNKMDMRNWFGRQSPLSALEHCVNTRAKLATQNLFAGAVGRDCVDRVLQEALRDTRPFTSSVPPAKQPAHEASSDR